MKISIILLAYNEEKNINDEIDSVQKIILDRLDNYEFIIAEKIIRWFANFNNSDMIFSYRNFNIIAHLKFRSNKA